MMALVRYIALGIRYLIGGEIVAGTSMILHFHEFFNLIGFLTFGSLF